MTTFASARLFLLLFLLLAISLSSVAEARRHRPREFLSEDSPANGERESGEEFEGGRGGDKQRTPETLESKTILQELPKEGGGEEGEGFKSLQPSSPFDEPKGLFGPMGPGGPECLDKRCNPFRSHHHSRPSVYYRRYLDKESGPFSPPKGFYPHMKKSYGHLPEYTEVIIIRKVPIMLSKLLVIAKANANGYKPPKPDYPVPPPDPVLFKKGGGELPGKLPPTKEVPPEMDELEEQLTLQRDQPTVELEERKKGKPKYDPVKDGAFESLMGNEEMVPVPEGVLNKQSGSKSGPGPEAKKSLGKGGEGGEVKQRQLVTEYLERPAEKSGGGDNRSGDRGEQRPPREE